MLFILQAFHPPGKATIVYEKGAHGDADRSVA